MKTLIRLAAIVAVSISGTANAWVSTYYDRTSGGSFTYSDAETPEAAQRLALKGCREKAPNADCVELGRPAHGTAVVIALGTKKSPDDAIYRVSNDDPDIAAQQALADCRDKARDCRLVHATWDVGYRWAAVASNQEDAIFLEYNAESYEAAKAGALRGCEAKAANKGNCKVIQDMVTANKAWFAIARNSGSSLYLRASEGSEQDAKQRAMDACRKGPEGTSCQVTEVRENQGLTVAPPAFTKLKARIERDEKQRQMPKKVAVGPGPSGNGECRPQGNTLRCTSQCSNGDCVVTYENGCKTRVQVQPRFDSSNNRWVYPAPSC